MQQFQRAPSGTEPSDEGWVTGYADPDGLFMGYTPAMTLVPGMIPAQFNVKTGHVRYTGNPKVIKPGEVFTTDSGFDGREKVVGEGMTEDIGADLPSKNAVPMPEMSEELRERIAARTTNTELEAAKLKIEALQSKLNETGPEETKAEETKAEETKAEETKAEETKAEETKAEETKAEETKAEETKAEETKPLPKKPNGTKSTGSSGAKS